MNAMNLLVYISLMASKNIPERVVQPLLFSDTFASEYGMSVSTLTSHGLVDVCQSNEGCILDMHPLIQSTVLERLLREPNELHYRLNKMAGSLLNLLSLGDNDIQGHMRDDEFLSLIPHVYAVAEKAVWISDDRICDFLVRTACQIAYLFYHIDTSTLLCLERLRGVSANKWQRVDALFEMGRSCELMANPQLAQTHLMEALRLIESSSDYDKTRMAKCYGLGELMLEGGMTRAMFIYLYVCLPVHLSVRLSVKGTKL
jgi:hypothetical protein